MSNFYTLCKFTDIILALQIWANDNDDNDGGDE